MRASSSRSTSGARIVRIAAVAACLASGMLACTEQTFLIPTPPNVPRDGSIAGSVVEFGSSAPVAGAALIMGGSATVTDAQGRFTLTGIPSTGEGAITVSAPGFVFRGQMFSLASARTGILLDLISQRPPFSLDFYRFFVRDGFEGSVLQRTAPWSKNPSFHVTTVVENTTIPVDPAVIAAIEVNFRKSVPELSGGRLQVEAFETGPAPRPAEDGWVNVIFSNDLQGALGRATVGGDSGTIWLRPGLQSTGVTNTNNCSTPEVFIADHEITHTMGFWHTPDLIADTTSGIGCPGAPRPAHTVLHAGIMYSRPRGNRDPDIDPTEILHATAPGRAPVVICRTLGR